MLLLLLLLLLLLPPLRKLLNSDCCNDSAVELRLSFVTVAVAALLLADGPLGTEGSVVGRESHSLSEIVCVVAVNAVPVVVVAAAAISLKREV